jgi:hypothetical protein
VDSNSLGYNPVIGSCEQGNEPSSSINDGEFQNELSDYLLLIKDLAPWSYFQYIGNFGV